MLFTAEPRGNISQKVTFSDFDQTYKVSKQVVSQPKNQESSLVDEIVELNALNQDATQEVVNGEVTVKPIFLKGGHSPATLTLHNFFDILNTTHGDLPVGEALHYDMDQVISSMDTQQPTEEIWRILLLILSQHMKEP